MASKDKDSVSKDSDSIADSEASNSSRSKRPCVACRRLVLTASDSHDTCINC